MDAKQPLVGRKTNRRIFFKTAAWAAAGVESLRATEPANKTTSSDEHGASGSTQSPTHPQQPISYPRVFEGPHLKMIAFPLGGVGAGSLSLGGRGQLRDWEIFNRPNKGFLLPYAFPSIWAQAGNAKPVARVLEARISAPYEGQDGLGSDNVPGLSRLEAARFTGEYPWAHIDFKDRTLPVHVSLDAFSPFMPHDPEDSGLPGAYLRYRVMNPNRVAATVSIAWSIDNPVKVSEDRGGAASLHKDERTNEIRHAGNLVAIHYSNPAIPATDPMKGSFVLGFTGTKDAQVSTWRGWPQGRWWNSPMLFWDQFSTTGTLGAEPEKYNTVGTLCVRRTIAPGATAEFTFVLAWYFPNRTPDWCGWSAPKGEGNTIIGNRYSARFEDSWEVTGCLVDNQQQFEERTSRFVTALRESTLPAAVKDGASANLSTLASTTSFRTADGEFHGFEGVDNQRGCCFGNCTHVWNYETTTAHLFPSLARSLRSASFGFSMDDAGAMHFRQLLPDGKQRSGYAATDGQMGQIVHAYLDWKLSGDQLWLERMWPRIKKGLEFAWVPGGWDANKDGVLEGVQHNTYDVEFYGPNPMCGIYYLAALRAGERMATAMGDTASAAEYSRLAEGGGKWIDANLFNGEFYVQKVRGFRSDQIAPNLRSDMGSEGTEHPEYQVGEGCLVDQLVGQSLAEVAGLGSLVSSNHVRKALQSVYKYNYKQSLADHDNVQRTFALNDEAALVVCDYGKAERPKIPFPYYAEVFTGLEYSTAAHMIFAGLVKEGVECIHSIRARYDGERRNPWDEAECGHHYARAMASWSAVVAMSGFQYDAPAQTLAIAPKSDVKPFQCFWSTGTGWGTFRLSGAQLTLRVLTGKLAVKQVSFASTTVGRHALIGSVATKADFKLTNGQIQATFVDPVRLEEGQTLTVG
jgi:non-lysosomal glucosylceramidase